MFCRYRAEMDAVMSRWRRLGGTLADNAQRIQELMAKLMQFEVRRTPGTMTWSVRVQGLCVWVPDSRLSTRMM